MKKIATLFLSLSLLISLVSCQQKTDKLLLGGSGWNKIVIIDKETKEIEWEYQLEEGWECNSVAYTPDGNILFSYGKGAKLMTKKKESIWDYEVPFGAEMQTATLLPNGNYLLAWCGYPATILEVKPTGEIVNQLDYDTRIRNPHSQFRQISMNKKGNYMIPLLATSEVREVTPNGEEIKSVKVAGNPFCVAQLPNGNYLVSGGDKHRYMELNFETEEIVQTIEAEDIPGVKLSFVAQLLPTANNGLYVCNWQGHRKKGSTDVSPQVFELNEKGEIIWSLNDNATFGMISAIYPIHSKK